MAKHILERGEHPVFYYGSAYGGSLEPHYVAAVFAVIGNTPTSYRIAMGGLVLLILLGVYLLTREAFGSLAAILALAYLAVPPFFFLYKGLTSDGHYNAFDLFTIGVLLLCLRIENTPSHGRDLRLLFAALGLVIGLGWWINPITPVISVAAILWLFLRRNPRPAIRNTALMLAGFLVGSAPWTIWNLRHRWSSLASPELGSVDAVGALRNLGKLVVRSLPLLAGGARLRVANFRDTFPLSGFVVGAVLLVVLVPVLRQVFRGDRPARLLVLAFGVLVATVVWSLRFDPTEPRVLFPYYVLVPPLIGAGLAWYVRRNRAKLVAAACTGILICAHAFSSAVEHRHIQNTPTEVTASLGDLLSVLERSRVRHVYTDYWTAYRVSFETNERIIATPIPGDEAVRYPAYQEQVANDPSAAIVVRGPRAVCLERYLQEAGLPNRRIVVQPFTVFADLPSSVLTFVGSKGGLPLPMEAYRVEWAIDLQPREIRRGSTFTERVAFRNTSSCSWPHAVHVGYHWRALEPGLPEIRDGGRYFPDQSIAPGETVAATVALVSPSLPGRYALEFDLVFENVAWFSSRGGSTATIPVLVR